jgi:hypothetical protein
MKVGTAIRNGARDLYTSWFNLSRDEQKVLLVVAIIFLVGLAARSRVRATSREPRQPPAPALQGDGHTH